MSCPATFTSPEVAVSRPPAIEHKVVLPEPEGPTSATISSVATLNVTPSSAATALSPSP